MIEHLKNQGFIESNFLTLNAIQIGAVLEMLIISVALADRFNQLVNQNLELNSIVITDTLTKIKNRRYFFERTKELLSSLKRKNEDYSLIMIDIDYFKKINDTYGHASGDKTLVTFTKYISSFLRDEDLFARIGGEEFILLTRANQTEAIQLSTRLKNATQDLKVSSDKGDISFTISMGICSFNNEELNVDELLKKADEALYEAKESGRNCIKSHNTIEY
jgi:diguanylate cyclase (GGDEF)-like protein